LERVVHAGVKQDKSYVGVLRMSDDRRNDGCRMRRIMNVKSERDIETVLHAAVTSEGRSSALCLLCIG
jgi:hypothetical protein